MITNEIAPIKLVFAPFGCDTYGEDILVFENGLLFALESATELTGQSVYSDIHDRLGGMSKLEHPVPTLSEESIRLLAERAQCDHFIDGALNCERDAATGALTEVIVALRIFHRSTNQFSTPEALAFRAFTEHGLPSKLDLDFDFYIALQLRLSETLLTTLQFDIPTALTADSLQMTQSWQAYELFLKAKRFTQIPESKLGYYEQAAKLDSGFFLALYNCAMLYKTQTDYNKERKRLSQAAAATNDPALLGDVYFELGLASIYLGDTKTARNFWERAIEFGGDNPSLYVNMAGTYEQEENWAEATRLNEEALERFPDFHKAIVNLGRLHAMFGRLDRAIPLYERALELQPDDALRHSVLGGCYLANERADDAKAQFTKAVALDPDGDPGKYAAQELVKLKKDSERNDPKKKKWGLF